MNIWVLPSYQTPNCSVLDSCKVYGNFSKINGSGYFILAYQTAVACWIELPVHLKMLFIKAIWSRQLTDIPRLHDSAASAIDKLALYYRAYKPALDLERSTGRLPSATEGCNHTGNPTV